jgi:rubrerythrin
MNKIKKTLKSDIRDEKNANKGYNKLAKTIGSKSASRTLRGIANDEADHKRLLTGILKKQK